MPATVGMGSYWGLGEQSAYSTPAAAAKYVRVASMSLKRTRSRKPRNHLNYNGVTAYAPREFFDERDDAGGGAEVPLLYNDGGIGMLLAAAMGGVTEGGAGPYTHDFVLKTPNDSDFLNGLTIFQGNGDEDAEVFHGCIVPGLELKGSSGGEVMLSLPGIIARTTAGLTSQGSPTFDTAAEFVDFDHFGSITWNGRTIASFKSFSLKVTRAYERRLYMGSLYTARPVQTGPIKIEFTAVVDHGEASDTASLDADWHLGTQADLALTATGTGNNALGLTVHNAYIEDVSRPVSGPGLIQSTIKWVGMADGTDQGCKIRLTNDEATYKT